MIQGLNPGRIGTSEAGKRIWDAGKAFQASRQPEPRALPTITPEPEPVAAVKAEAKAPQPKKRPAKSFSDFVAEVSRRTQVPIEDIFSDKLDEETSHARQACYYACAVGTTKPISVIARYFNRRRNAVRFGIKAVAKRYGLPVPDMNRWQR